MCTGRCLAWHSLPTVLVLTGGCCSLIRPCVAHTMSWLLCMPAGAATWPCLLGLRSLTITEECCCLALPSLSPALALVLPSRCCSLLGESPNFSCWTWSYCQISCVLVGAKALLDMVCPQSWALHMLADVVASPKPHPTSPGFLKCQVSS